MKKVFIGLLMPILILIIFLCVLIIPRSDIKNAKAVISSDYSSISYDGKTYVPIDVNDLPAEVKNEFNNWNGEDAIKATVEKENYFLDKYFLTNQLIVREFDGETFLYLNTDYDVNESDYYCTVEYKEKVEHFGFTKKEFSVVEELDTHGGFHGDGSYYLILDCSDNKEKALELVKEWKELPLSENLELIMYGGERNGVTYSYELAKFAHIPKIENGYYIFKDRTSESKDSADDSELFDRHSLNFSLAIYDCDTNKMYYIEFDT